MPLELSLNLISNESSEFLLARYTSFNSCGKEKKLCTTNVSVKQINDPIKDEVQAVISKLRGKKSPAGGSHQPWAI